MAHLLPLEQELLAKETTAVLELQAILFKLLAAVAVVLVQLVLQRRDQVTVLLEMAA
jgi:hypothetical protein